MTIMLVPARRYVFFVLAALSLMMFSIDSTIVAVALPTMTADLRTNLVWIGWTLTAYQLTQTIVLPLAGKLAESFGRARVFLACVVLFTLGSLLCGLAPNVHLLIVFRVLQALGGGGFMPSAVGIITEEFPEARQRMIGLFTSIFPIGGIVGPNLGGFIIEHASWRDVFFINVPIGVVVIVLLFGRARHAVAGRRRRIDFAGTALFASAILLVLSAMTLVGEDPSFLRGPAFWAMLVGGALLLAVFVWHEKRTDEPVVDPTLVARNPFLAVNAYNFFFGACAFGFFAFIPYYATVQFGMGPEQAGAVLTPRSLMMMVTAALASFFIIRLGYRAPMVVGMLLISGMLLLLSRGYSSATLLGVALSPFWLLALQVMIGGVGMGLASPASNNAALDLLPERAPVLTGIRGMFRSTGGVIGTALIVLWLEFSPDKGVGVRSVYFALAMLLLFTIPLVFLIPDTADGRRRRQVGHAGGSEDGLEVNESVPVEAGHAPGRPSRTARVKPRT
ncbi:MAG TPA: MFS transporter [Chloroflexota bacterium]|nr:MFS transporter [Chloroflexota bacterium]